MSASAPRFSVVIAAFNAERTVVSAVRSALSQTAADLEVIVVDDGSTDSTAAVASGIDDPRVAVVRQENRGLAAARNAGIAHARGSYVSFLDSDDLWLPDYLELAGAGLDTSRTVGFAYTDAYAFESSSGRVRIETPSGEMWAPVPPPTDHDAFLLELLKRNFVYVSTTVRRSVLNELGCFDERLRRSPDYDLWLRIVRAGYDAAWVRGQHAMYRIHDGQMSRDSLGMLQNELALLSEIDPVTLPSDAHREVLVGRCGKLERQIRAADRPLGQAVRRARSRLGRMRRRLDLAYHWYDVPPSEVSAAFPDLKAI